MLGLIYMFVIILCFFMCMVGGSAQATDNFVESAPFFHIFMGSRDGSKVSRFAQSLDPLSHLANPRV